MDAHQITKNVLMMITIINQQQTTESYDVTLFTSLMYAARLFKVYTQVWPTIFMPVQEQNYKLILSTFIEQKLN